MIDLPGAAALRSLRAGLGATQVQLLPPDLPTPAPPTASSAPVPTPAPAASTPANRPLRFGRYRLDGPTWELHAALAALRRDTLTGRDLRRHLAELDAAPGTSSTRGEAPGPAAGAARGR